MIYIVIATTKGRRERLKKCISAIQESTYYPFSLLLYENHDGGCVVATKKAIEGLHAPMFLLNDDMIIAPDCLERLVAAYNRNFPNHDGICQPWDPGARGTCAVAPFGHSDLLRKFMNGYNHYWWDAELYDVMRARGKYVVVDDAKFIHEHPNYGLPVERDETYRTNVLKFDEDAALYKRRQAAGFPDLHI